ncbi:MAG: radical SAM protein, partial [Chloroflexota bacterium]|nr:radical SAM protein [Chloroflexota bacterium]
ALRDLDRLPFPKWELVPYKKYRMPKSSARSTVPFLPLLTSRGCPVGCHYCPYPVGQGLLWRWRSPQNVVDEIEHLVRDLGIRHIIFRDPMFSLNQKRVIEICDEIIRRNLVFEWRCETRVDFLKEETLGAMARAGCVGINFGVESADVAIQANVGRKPIAQEEFVKTIGLCRQLGIKTFAFFIIGLPGDTLETTLKTIKFAIDIRTTWVQFTAASPFIGTKLRDWAIAHQLTSQDEYAYINSHLVLMGNENQSKDQVKILLDFAQFFENYLINRKSILKDDHSPSRIYRAVQSLADELIHRTALSVFAIGQRRLRAQVKLRR